jgi:short-subunit dehydrogenase
MKIALITGASSGIGHELALQLARRGFAVALVARRSDLLDVLAREIEASGGRAVALTADAGNAEEVREAVCRAEELLGGTIDLAVANAGISLRTHGTDFSIRDAEQMMRVNVLGMFYLFAAVVPSMVARRSGRFAGVASIAGLRGLPGSAVYSATKAAMQAFLEASRIELAPHGVGVSIINPGYVATPMTEKNRFRMPFLMPVEAAAARIVTGLERGEREIEFPRPMSLLVRLGRLLPNALYDRCTAPFARHGIDR